MWHRGTRVGLRPLSSKGASEHLPSKPRRQTTRSRSRWDRRPRFRNIDRLVFSASFCAEWTVVKLASPRAWPPLSRAPAWAGCQAHPRPGRRHSNPTQRLVLCPAQPAKRCPSRPLPPPRPSVYKTDKCRSFPLYSAKPEYLRLPPAQKHGRSRKSLTRRGGGEQKVSASD